MAVIAALISTIYLITPTLPRALKERRQVTTEEALAGVGRGEREGRGRKGRERVRKLRSDGIHRGGNSDLEGTERSDKQKGGRQRRRRRSSMRSLGSCRRE